MSPYNGASTPISAKVLWTREHLDALPRYLRASERHPHGFIIGARKAGTFALQAFLSNHPQIWTRYWEDGFFCREDFYSQGLLPWLKTLKPRSKTTNILKVAEYFHRDKVPPRIFAVDKNSKIIVIVRDPIIRMISDYLFLQRYKPLPFIAEKNYTLSELLLDPRTGGINKKWGCIERSLYAKHFARWIRWFPKNQILVVNGDDLASNNPANELQRVESFLGLDSHFTQDSFYYNETKGFYCLTSTGCLGSGKGHVAPSLETKLERKLRAFFRPYNEQFYEYTGINFEWE